MNNMDSLARDPLRVVVLISGGGSTMEHVILNTLPNSVRPNFVTGALADKARVAGVISNTSLAGGLVKLEQLRKKYGTSMPSIVLNKALCKGDENALADAMTTFCESVGAEIVMACEYVDLVPAKFVRTYEGRIFKQHPAPLDPGFPDFGGQLMYELAPHMAVIRFARLVRRKVKTWGTVQRMTEEYDKGEVVWRSDQIEVIRSMTPKKLQEKLLPHEHAMVVRALERIALCHRSGRSLSLMPPKERVVREGEEEAWKQAMEYARGA